MEVSVEGSVFWYHVCGSKPGENGSLWCRSDLDQRVRHHRGVLSASMEGSGFGAMGDADS